jgi:hypothetical protein
VMRVAVTDTEKLLVLIDKTLAAFLRDTNCAGRRRQLFRKATDLAKQGVPQADVQEWFKNERSARARRTRHGGAVGDASKIAVAARRTGPPRPNSRNPHRPQRYLKDQRARAAPADDDPLPGSLRRSS